MVEYSVMKRAIIFLSLIVFSNAALADGIILPEYNPFLGTFQNQISMSLGQGFDTGWLLPPPVRPVPFYIGTITYSQPTSFFRVPARRSINISETLGLHEKNGWKWQDYTIPMAYITEDIALFRIDRFYGGVGAGAGLQAQENERLGAKLVFQFKVSFGYNFNKKWAGEFYIQHFSNANTATENNSYAFYGLGFTYNY